MDPFVGSKFVLDFAKAVVSWYGDARNHRIKNAAQVSHLLNTIAASLSEYSELIRKGDEQSRGQLVKNRYFLDCSLHSLAYIIELNENHPASPAISRLRRLKVYDGALVPETGIIIDGSRELTPARMAALADEMQRAAGEFEAAAAFIDARA